MAHEHRNEAPIEDELRGRWLLAIERLGSAGAVDDAVDALAVRFGCQQSEARRIVRRAWRSLALPGFPD